MIRKANKNDKSKVCDLILMASSCLFSDVIKSDDLQKQKELVMKLYDLKDTKFHYENIVVYEQDNKVVGCMVSYEANKEVALNKTMEEFIDNGYKFAVEGIPNTIYLDSMAVDPDYQGLGISRKILAYFTENSTKDLSCLVETYKKETEKYYQRVGFEVVQRVNLFNCELDSMIYKINK
ncbi:N-acetylglutamate synthase-like GNAT family acetyltransferase [Bacilli bacterium PM5-9]|nr:N-acetylglutamate synthase-like GNAT family acetyltransferase [Bacilli bacterium PM5-9]